MIPLNKNIPLGDCQCGCGGKTKISPITNRSIGWIKGVPTRFILGHGARKPRIDTSKEEPFFYEGSICRRISLTRGMFAIVDASDYEWLSQFMWNAASVRKGESFYAARKEFSFGKKTGAMLYMHRLILKLPLKDSREGDHRNGNTLDYRRCNLRRTNSTPNKHNHKLSKKNTSGRDGVSYDKSRNKWVASMKINGRQTHFGRYDLFSDACAARSKAEREHRGEFVREGINQV